MTQGIHWIDKGIRPNGDMEIYRDGVLRVTIKNNGDIIVHTGNASIAGDTVINGNTIIQGTTDIQSNTNINANLNVSGSITSSTMTSDSSGMAISAGFGCNGASPQTPKSVGSDASDLSSVITLCNNLKAALVANGICS